MKRKSDFLILVSCISSAYYIHHCTKSDPELNECLRYSGNRLTEYMRHGIAELGITDVSIGQPLCKVRFHNVHFQIEPVVIDEISISLGGGPDGYRATFKNIEAYGVSNLTISNLR
jgi:Haemolymph juvenile hormone binding protein (JHBP)